jgi:hypothetical protein
VDLSKVLAEWRKEHRAEEPKAQFDWRHVRRAGEGNGFALRLRAIVTFFNAVSIRASNGDVLSGRGV